MGLPVANLAGRVEAGYSLILALGMQWKVDNDMEDCGLNPPDEYPCAADWGKTYSTLGLTGGPTFATTINFGWYKDGPGRIMFNNDECSVSQDGTIGLTFITQEGAIFHLRDQQTNGQPPATGPNMGRIFVSGEGSLTFISDADVLIPESSHCSNDFSPNMNRFALTGYLALPNGIHYRVEGSYIKWMRDRNGNLVKVFYSPEPNEFQPQARLTKVVDSLNREINIAYGVTEPEPFGLSDVITVQGFAGTTKTLRVSYKPLTDILRSDLSVASIDQQFSDIDPNMLYPNTVFRTRPTPYYPGSMPSSKFVNALWLPDGRAYKFKYNNYGELARLEKPTGGAYEYDWGAADGGHGSGLHKGATR